MDSGLRRNDVAGVIAQPGFAKVSQRRNEEMKIVAKAALGLLAVMVAAQPALAATRLSDKDEARVSRAARKDRPELRACLIDRKKGEKKGAIVGAVGGGATVAAAGGNVGKSLLGAGVGALLGSQVGKGTSTDSRCDALMRRNP
jgi:hypothetical protein